MKKRLALVMVSIMLLTGCGISQRKRDDIINKLEDKDIIKENWELIEWTEISAAPVPGIRSYKYFYKDINTDEVYSIELYPKISDEESEYYRVISGNGITGSEEEEFKYDYSEDYKETKYRVHVKKFLIFNSYDVEKIEED